MALGALVGAYQEDESGGLRALLPLSGRSLIEYQARCLAAAGAAPIVVYVDRIPPALQQAFERLRLEGISVVPVTTGAEAASRFEAGSAILLVGDGVAPPADLVARLADESEGAVLTVADDLEHESFERIDAESRWAGLAVIDAQMLNSTAAMLGDWDLQSTLLRRTIQEGAFRRALVPGEPEPVLVDRAEQLAAFEQGLFAASLVERLDWASRFVLPPVEDFATRQLAETRLQPALLVWLALGLTLVGAFFFSRGWLWAGVVALLASVPLDRIARRLASLRLRPLPKRMLAARLLWPAAGLALAGLAWWDYRFGSGWGSLVAAASTLAFAEAGRVEQFDGDYPGRVWLFSRRNAILLSMPFAIFGGWTGYLVSMAGYAGASFLFSQHLRHRTVTS